MGSIADIVGDIKVLVNAATSKAPPDDEIASFSLLVEKNAAAFPNATALLCEEEVISWQQLNHRANRVAHLLKAQGIAAGDCVSLFMQNRIEFVVNVIAICKLGGVAGLINTNLTHKPLIHCINLVASKKCIFGEELCDAINEVRDELALEDGRDFLFVKDTGAEPPPDWCTVLDSKDEAIEAGNPPDTNEVTINQTAFYRHTNCIAKRLRTGCGGRAQL